MKTAKRTNTIPAEAVATAPSTGNTAEELTEISHLEARLVELDNCQECLADQADRQALLAELKAIQDSARERAAAEDFSLVPFLEGLTGKEAQQVLKDAQRGGPWWPEERARMVELSERLEEFPRAAERNRTAERQTIQARLQDLRSAPARRAAIRPAKLAMAAAADAYGRAADELEAIESELQALFGRLRKVRDHHSAAAAAEDHGMNLMRTAGLPTSHFLSAGIRDLAKKPHELFANMVSTMVHRDGGNHRQLMTVSEKCRIRAGQMTIEPPARPVREVAVTAPAAGSTVRLQGEDEELVGVFLGPINTEDHDDE